MQSGDVLNMDGFCGLAALLKKAVHAGSRPVVLTYYTAVKAALGSWFQACGVGAEVDTVRQHKGSEDERIVVYVCRRHADEQALRGHLLDRGRLAVLLTRASQSLHIVFDAGVADNMPWRPVLESLYSVWLDRWQLLAAQEAEELEQQWQKWWPRYMEEMPAASHEEEVSRPILLASGFSEPRTAPRSQERRRRGGELPHPSQNRHAALQRWRPHLLNCTTVQSAASEEQYTMGVCFMKSRWLPDNWDDLPIGLAQLLSDSSERHGTRPRQSPSQADSAVASQLPAASGIHSAAITACGRAEKWQTALFLTATSVSPKSQLLAALGGFTHCS
eukprot:s4513_g9.t1